MLVRTGSQPIQELVAPELFAAWHHTGREIYSPPTLSFVEAATAVLHKPGTRDQVPTLRGRRAEGRPLPGPCATPLQPSKQEGVSVAQRGKS